MGIPELLATLKSIQAADASRFGKLHAWLPDGSRVFFVWDGKQYQARPE